MLPRGRSAVLLAGSFVLTLAVLFPPWWYEWEPNDPAGLNIYNVNYHALWYQSEYGGEIVGFLYGGQLVTGLFVFARCLVAARARREAARGAKS